MSCSSTGSASSAACFSALQRAENSSMPALGGRLRCRGEFQCSSASRKFLNFFENFTGAYAAEFQCSSASRKFLNGSSPRSAGCDWSSFSALQRAENSSMRFVQAAIEALVGFSALQRAENSSISLARRMRSPVLRPVSVLFSEPKIPQYICRCSPVYRLCGFSALQRAENSSIDCRLRKRACSLSFSALQRAENSSIGT